MWTAPVITALGLMWTATVIKATVPCGGINEDCPCDPNLRGMRDSPVISGM